MELTREQQRLQEILQFQKTEAAEYLARVLNNLAPDTFEEIVNRRLPEVSRQQVASFLLARLDEIDRYPNPRDRHLSRDELTEAIERSVEPNDVALLLYAWLQFDEIRSISQDFHGAEAAFDYVITDEDLKRYGQG